MSGSISHSNCQLSFELNIPDDYAVVEITVYTTVGEDSHVFTVTDIPPAWDEEKILQAYKVTKSRKQRIRGIE